MGLCEPTELTRGPLVDQAGVTLGGGGVGQDVATGDAQLLQLLHQSLHLGHLHLDDRVSNWNSR